MTIMAVAQASAYMLVRSGTAWSEEEKLAAVDGAEVDLFGYSVSVDGETALVSARGHDSFSGSAYVFTLGPADADGDGVPDDHDACAGTVHPEPALTPRAPIPGRSKGPGYDSRAPIVALI